MKDNIEMISAQGLGYAYPAYESENSVGEPPAALFDVNLTVKQGEFVAILGHNGSGKSTLAKCMNALLIPTEGVVFVDGYDTSVEENVWFVRQAAGMVFQNPDNQIVAAIVEEDVAFGAENLGIAPKEIRLRVDNALKSVGMEEYADYSPHFLSGGQKQRIAIAGILAMKPKCIILDEPTAMLDPVGRREVLESVMRLNRDEGITVVLITHYMDEAVKADRVIVMEEGKIVMDGTPKAVFSRIDELKAIGLDVPQVTEIAHKLRLSGVNLPDGILTIEEFLKEFIIVQK